MLHPKQVAYFVLADTYAERTETAFWQYLGAYSETLGLQFRDFASWTGVESGERIERFLCWLRGSIFGTADAETCEHEIQKCSLPPGCGPLIEVCTRCGGVLETIEDDTVEV